MNYKFAKIILHPKVPNLTEWRLIISPEDIDVHLNTHKSLASSMVMGDLSDPHHPKEMQSCPKCKPEQFLLEYLKNPIILSAKWLEATTNEIFINGNNIAVNSKGGWCTFNPSQVIQEIETDECVFPGTNFSTLKKKKITISRWPNGQHWYLNANWCNVFMPNKYNTIEEAIELAKEYVDDEYIEVKDKKYLN